MKVLIVDDSVTIRMILKGLLKQLELTDVVEACDGKAALEVLSKQPIGLLLLDIHMPNMDGLACLGAVKQNPALAGTPVIIISSDTTPEQIESARALGAHAYIKKPFRIEGLREALEALFPAAKKAASVQK
jgi:two-component system chemotaxis response regulator CheY